MKKISFMAMLLCAGMAFVSCNDDDEIQFNGDDYEVSKIYVVDFEGSTFTNLIDDVQYGGELIYSSTPYTWVDASSSLTGEVVKADWTAWGLGYGWDNGFAISNYVDAEAADFMSQLAVPVSNGSKNFAVCFSGGSKLTFADGQAHKVLKMQYSPTSYVMNNELQAADKDYEFKVIITFEHADESTTTRTLYLAVGKKVQQGWETADFGDVEPFVSATFNFDGTDKGDWGVNTPMYVAIDNIIVQK